MIKSLLNENKESFIKFCIIGGFSTIINYGLFYTLFTLVNLNYLLSSASGYISGTLFGFYLNKTFTFKSKAKRHGVEISKYFFVYTFSLFAGLLFLRGQVFFGIPIFLANFIVIGFTTIINYLGSKYFVFSKTFIIKNINYKIYKYRYFLRYFLIGVLSIIIELGTILLFRDLIDTKILMLLGFILSMLFAFYINTKFNFKVKKRDSLKTFAFFISIATFVYTLNLIIIELFYSFNFSNYIFLRLFTASIFFMLSYTLHRNITFKNTKQVGVAIYLQKKENLDKIMKHVGGYVDWLHLDLIDNTFKKDTDEVDLSIGHEIKRRFPEFKTMTHIMSDNPSKWIEKVAPFSNYIIIHSTSKEPLEENIKKIKQLKRKVGFCILSKNKLQLPKNLLRQINLIQVLGIDNPGYSGQKMNKSTFSILKQLQILKKSHRFEICLDGGVKESNINLINSKYIVSGSTILNSKTPRKTIYNLKTPTKQIRGEPLKIFIGEHLLNKLETKDYIKSLTLVGSFAEKGGLEGISDIDLVVILDKLTKGKFDDLINSLEEIRKPLKNKWGYDMKINTTFGPLKFNYKKTVVFHLMVYDIKRHIEHCNKSPFTCIDWQRALIYKKTPMLEIYPVNKLQPNYFFNSRRGISEYLTDLNDNSISYREYEFIGKEIKENVKHKRMTNKDKYEYAFHIMKFCMLNFLKLKTHEYKHLPQKKLLTKYFELFSKNKELYLPFIKMLNTKKAKNKFKPWKDKYYHLLYSFL